MQQKDWVYLSFPGGRKPAGAGNTLRIPHVYPSPWYPGKLEGCPKSQSKADIFVFGGNFQK